MGWIGRNGRCWVEDLTPTQERALNYIQQLIAAQGSPPTLRELCDFMGYKAIGSAQDLVAALRRKGYLEQPERQAARAFSLTEKARDLLRHVEQRIEDFSQSYLVPCLGSVPAGNPLEAIEEQIGTLHVSPSMFGGKHPPRDNLFALRARGLSMQGAGILDGDWLVVNAQTEAEPGSIVVARLEDDATVKRLQRHPRRGWYLQPENPDFSPVYADEQAFEVIGKVMALQRII